MKFVITAGPTREPIDPVRYLSNRSSGKMGYALAEAALAAGHEVALISGPVCLTPPPAALFIPAVTAEEMFQTVQTRMNTGCDVFIMCAAAADFRPAKFHAHKIKKSAGFDRIDLVPARDILASLAIPAQPRAIIVGFAAETQSLAAHAQKKLREKQCDVICANDVTRMDTGFESDDNELTLFFRDGSQRHFPRAPKRALAQEIVKICIALAEKR